MKISVDTNVLVRWPAWDDEAQAAAVIEAADEVHVSTIVLCEVV